MLSKKILFTKNKGIIVYFTSNSNNSESRYLRTIIVPFFWPINIALEYFKKSVSYNFGEIIGYEDIGKVFVLDCKIKNNFQFDSKGIEQYWRDACQYVVEFNFHKLTKSMIVIADYDLSLKEIKELIQKNSDIPIEKINYYNDCWLKK